MKIHPVGAELFNVDRHPDGWMDRQADMPKLMDAFHNFINTPKTGQYHMQIKIQI